MEDFDAAAGLLRELWPDKPVDPETFIGHIDELVVHRGSRGRGIGGLLLASFEIFATKRKGRRIELDSAFHRQEAHKFYEQHGFENQAYVFSKLL